MLNSKRIKELFDEKSVYISKVDVVLLSHAKQLFGEFAAEFAFKGSRDTATNAVHFNNFSVEYLTFEAFKLAAACYNMEQIYDLFEKDMQTSVYSNDVKQKCKVKNSNAVNEIRILRLV